MNKEVAHRETNNHKYWSIPGVRWPVQGLNYNKQ